MYQADSSAPYDKMTRALTSFVTEGDAEVALKHGAAAWLAIISERFDDARLAAARALAVKDLAVPDAAATLCACSFSPMPSTCDARRSKASWKIR